MGAGIAVGVGGSLWAQRRVKSVLARYRPASVGAGAVDRAKVWPGQVRAAIQEGRLAMREREAELRSPRSRGSQTPTRP